MVSEVPSPVQVSDGLRLHVLGCDGTYAGAGGACSGYLVETETHRLWIDAGPGTLARLQRHISLTDVDALVITHEHPDHSGELPVLRNALRFVLGVGGLPVLTTTGTRQIVEQLTGGAEPTFAWDVVQGGDERWLGDLRIRFVTTEHPVETLAVRLDHPSGSLVYTADTGPGLDGALLDPDGTGVDALLVECSLDAEQAGVVAHLTATETARLAIDAGARSVIVTHVVPGVTPADRCAEVEAALREADVDLPVIAAGDHQTTG
jgi:ribonuclease BN (tRNA processing enzyme)